MTQREGSDSEFDRRTRWAEEHDRKRREWQEARDVEHRVWAQAQVDREYRIQVEILSELRRIKTAIAHLR